jgi:hypothetical protein
MMINNARIAFGPAALSRFTQIIEEVTVDLVGDGLAAELVRSDEMRRKRPKGCSASLASGGQILKLSSFC